MAKITLDTLMKKLADPNTSEKKLAKYFKIDEDASGAFSPRFVLNEDKVDIPEGPEGLQKSAQVLNSANWLSRMSRHRKFHKKIHSGYNGPILVSEGDSWFQYPLFLTDTIDHIMDDYAVYSLGAAGDLLDAMAKKQEYLKALEDTGASILLLSGGGNDLVAGGALADHLEEFDPNLKPGDYLKRSFQGLLDNAFAQYEKMFTQVHGCFPDVSIICHGYDYIIPDHGKWLGKPMESQNINDKKLQKKIGVEMMDRFNRGLRRLVKTMPHVTYIDCRNVVHDDRWYNELHPTDEGYAAVAKLFKKEIRKLANRRSAPPKFISGPFGTAKDFERSVASLSAPAITTAGRKGRSLHLGLNFVDPAHYAGWDGQLNACENDAVAMINLADKQGFEPTLLLTAEATRERFIEEVKSAARDLDQGDMFFMTVSCHGGQIPDFNFDEIDDGDQPMDETLCLYDLQIADDELFQLWSKFKPGVRIVVLPDTCHSGSMIRANFMDMLASGQPLPDTGIKRRMMPTDVAFATTRQNLETYRAVADSYSGIKEDIISNPLKTPVKASVLSISACQDNQFAMDGHSNGAFTGAVLDVWDNGRFSGSYQDFRNEITVAIDSVSQVPKLYEIGLIDPGFKAQTPFTLWSNPRGTVLNKSSRGTRQPNAGWASSSAKSPAAAMMADEGNEADTLSKRELQDLYNINDGTTEVRSSDAALNWPDYADFVAFIEGLGLQYFKADEFIVLGGSHGNSSSPCHGKNTYPPRNLWQNIANTAHAIDALRHLLQKPIAISNAYRAPAYNTCIGGAKASQHMRFCAVDFSVSGMTPRDVAWALRKMRDDDNLFRGGIGLYNTFVHVDSRGQNATWPPSFKGGTPPVRSVSIVESSHTSQTSRINAIKNTPLAALPRGIPRSLTSAFRENTQGPGEPINLLAGLQTHQQELKAAVNASAVVSFVENLTSSQKEDVLLSTLFAQRAATAKHDPVGEIEEWYGEYVKILGILGWVTEGMPFQEHTNWEGSLNFDQVAIGLIASIATGNQMNVLNSALDALRGLADNDGRIKLFDLSTSKTTGGNFQIGVAMASGDVISMALGAFHYLANDQKRNVLFVKWGHSEVRFWMGAQRMSLSPTAYSPMRPIVQERLNDTRKKLIADIPLV